jgi:hypothetical protein
MSMHLLPKTILKRMDRTREKILLAGGEEKRRNNTWLSGSKLPVLNKKEVWESKT